MNVVHRRNTEARAFLYVNPAASGVFAQIVFCILLSIYSQAFGQEVPQNITKEDLAKNNTLFIELASKYLHWDEPTDPIKIVGPLYFVGTRGLSSWLFVTSEGNILLNTGTPNSGPMIVESIRKLGFKPEDKDHHQWSWSLGSCQGLRIPKEAFKRSNCHYGIRCSDDRRRRQD
jgi:hypothetical protein